MPSPERTGITETAPESKSGRVLADSRRDVATVKSRLDGVVLSLTDTRTDVARLRGEISELRENVGDLRVEVTQAKDAVSTLSGQLFGFTSDPDDRGRLGEVENHIDIAVQKMHHTWVVRILQAIGALVVSTVGAILVVVLTHVHV